MPEIMRKFLLLMWSDHEKEEGILQDGFFLTFFLFLVFSPYQKSKI